MRWTALVLLWGSVLSGPIAGARPAAGPTPLLAAKTGLYALAAVGGRLYYRTHTGDIMSLPLRGGRPRKVGHSDFLPERFVGDAKRLYFTGLIGGLWSIRATGGEPDSLFAAAERETTCDGLWRSQRDLYVLADDSLQVLHGPRGSLRKLFAAPEAQGLLGDEEALYWLIVPKRGPGQLWRWPFGGKASALARQVACDSLQAVDAENVYCTANRKLVRVKKRPGGKPELVPLGKREPAQVLASGGALLVLDGGQSVVRLAVSGGAGVILAQASADTEITQLLVAGDWLYWVEGGHCSEKECGPPECSAGRTGSLSCAPARVYRKRLAGR